MKFGYAMPSWFDFNSLYVHDIDEDAESMGVSVEYVHWLIAKEMKHGINPQRILVVGFAQGGSVALMSAVRSRGR